MGASTFQKLQGLFRPVHYTFIFTFTFTFAFAFSDDLL
jgi:hypothetical protein